jgi:hypothetical protein
MVYELTYMPITCASEAAAQFFQKRERLGLPEGNTDPELDKYDDTEWQIKEEPEELIQARKKFDNFVAADQHGASALPSCCILVMSQ